MINQNIKIALCATLGLIVLWLIILCFIKIDISTQTLVTFDGQIPIVYLTNKEASYIEENDRADLIRFYYDGRYQTGQLINPEVSGDWTSYVLSTKASFNIEKQTSINLIIDSLNVYQYLIKK